MAADHRIEIDAMGSNPLLPFLRKSPGEVLIHATGFLDAKSLFSLHEAVSSGCAKINKKSDRRDLTKLRAVCDDKGLWQTLLRLDFEQNAVQQNDLRAILHPRSTYVAELERKKEEEKERLRLQEQQQAHNQRQECYRPFSACFHCLQGPIGTCCTPVLGTAFSILLVLQLSAGEEVTWSTLIPMLILVGIISCAVCLMCYVGRVDKPVPFRDDTYDRSEGIVKEVFQGLDDKPGALSALCVALLGVLATIIFSCLRVTGEIDWNWHYVFTPMYFDVCFLLFSGPYVFQRVGGVVGDIWDSIGQTLACSVILLLPLLIFLVLLAEHLEGHGINVTEVLIPFFIIDGLSLCVTFLFALDDDLAEDYPVDFPVALLAWCLVVGLMLAFEVMIAAIHDDSDTPLKWAHVFIPFWIWAAGWLFAGCAKTAEWLKGRYDLNLCVDCCED